jgi:polar amino acid transport system substrate-binding protein
MMPEDNSKFRDLVNYTLAKFMQGYLMERPDDVAVINRWFGAEGVTPINQDLVVEFFRDIIDTHSQVPIAP